MEPEAELVKQSSAHVLHIPFQYQAWATRPHTTTPMNSTSPQISAPNIMDKVILINIIHVPVQIYY
jgi:hypothetical protein